MPDEAPRIEITGPGRLVYDKTKRAIVTDPERAAIVMGHALTLAGKGAETETRGLGGCGQGDLINALERTPLARSERESYKRRDVDAVYLSRFDGTDYCQWVGRKGDGYFHPIGRIMRIIKVDGR